MLLAQIHSPPQSARDHSDQLLFETPDGSWSRLPEWAQNFIQLGHQCACLQTSKYRRVIALSLPCRDFAALFIVAGLVSARLSRNLTEDEKVWQLEMLCGLSEDTGVEIWQGEKRQRGRVISHSGSGPDRQLRVRTGRGEQVTLIELKNACLVALKRRNHQEHTWGWFGTPFFFHLFFHGLKEHRAQFQTQLPTPGQIVCWLLTVSRANWRLDWGCVGKLLMYRAL
jgi:hypothetical protein